MLPKNSKHYIKPTADKLDISTDLVDDAVSFYYSGLRKVLHEMKGPNIQVENLGSFKVKQSELSKLTDKFNRHLNVLKPETFRQMAVKKNIETKLKKVTNLQKIIDEEKVRKQNFMKTKNEQRNAKQNMEQPEGDS